ncbi:hypothetical protein LBMAG35_10610 [Chlorobiota bacterium]|nr:hypothetical protein LBMAG35_10610 [Chlorobiota bacterium]
MASPLYIRLQSIRASIQSQWGDAMRHSLQPIMQSNLSRILVSLFVFSIFIQILTGIMLSLHFVPSSSMILTDNGKQSTVKLPNKVMLDPEGDTLAMPGELLLREAQQQDIKPTISFVSVKIIESSFPLNIIRIIHRMNTHVLLAVLLSIILMFIIHLRDTIFFKGIWFLLLVLGTGISLIAWTGYILPWDQYASTSYSMVSGFIRTGLESFAGSSEAFTSGAIQTDFIARLFSIHALILPFLMMFLLFYIKMILQINSSYSNNVFGYGFVALIILMGIFRSSEATLFPPSDAQVPTIIGIEPAWFFQPLHGIVSALPADAGILVISCAIVMFLCLPFISLYRLRMIVLAFIAIATLFFALAY